MINRQQNLSIQKLIIRIKISPLLHTRQSLKRLQKIKRKPAAQKRQLPILITRILLQQTQRLQRISLTKALKLIHIHRRRHIREHKHRNPRGFITPRSPGRINIIRQLLRQTPNNTHTTRSQRLRNNTVTLARNPHRAPQNRNRLQPLLRLNVSTLQQHRIPRARSPQRSKQLRSRLVIADRPLNNDHPTRLLKIKMHLKKVARTLG